MFCPLEPIYNVGLMLGQRLRRWPSIDQTLYQCVLFAGKGTSSSCASFHSSLKNSTLMNTYGDVHLVLLLGTIIPHRRVGGSDVCSMLPGS